MAVVSLANKTKSRSLLVGNAYFQPSSFESIATVTGNGSATSLTFSSIPSTYKHLQIRGIVRDNSGGNASSTVVVEYNGVSTYTGRCHYMTAIADSSPYMSVGSNTNAMRINYLSVGTAGLTNTYGVIIFDVLDYASTTKNKVYRSISGVSANGNTNNTENVSMNSGLWVDTSAITSIKFSNDNANPFSSSTQFALYGIKGE